MDEANIIKQFIPTSIVTMQDIGRMQRELVAINAFFHLANHRQAGHQASLPRTTTKLENLARQFNCNLLQQEDRVRLGDELSKIRHSAKPIDISFAAIPSALFLQKIINWLRANIDKNIVINVGYQPNIVSGCVIRTPYRTYDLSVGRKFANAKPALMALIRQ